jgi:hypothetical protein
MEGDQVGLAALAQRVAGLEEIHAADLLALRAQPARWIRR